jgi:hypothetical protein
MKLLPVGIISLPFYNNNKKKDIKEKQERIQAWIKGTSQHNNNSNNNNNNSNSNSNNNNNNNNNNNSNNNKWSFLYTHNDNKETFSIHGEEKSSDKNRIVLIALVELMEWIYNKDKKKILIVYTNSSYVVNCISDWCDKWRRTNYKINREYIANEFEYSNIDCDIQIKTMDRPNADILRRIDKLKSHINIVVNRLMVENKYSIMTNDLIDNN